MPRRMIARGSGSWLNSSTVGAVRGGEHYRLVVDAGGVEVDGRSRLGAQVAVTEVEVESTDVVGAAEAGELHAAFNAFGGVVSLHHSSVVFSRLSNWVRRWGSECNKGGVRRSSILGMGCRTAEVRGQNADVENHERRYFCIRTSDF